MKKLIFLAMLLLGMTSCDLIWPPEPLVDQLTITITCGEHGSVSPNGTYSVKYGADATFDIAPAPGYAIYKIFVDDKAVTKTYNYTFSKVTTNHKLEVVFIEKSAEVYFVKTEIGIGGTVTPSIAEVKAGQSASFTPKANEGYEVDKVLLDGTIVTLINGTYTATNVTSDHTLSVFFKEKQKFAITATAGAGGTISPAGEVNVYTGLNIQFIITHNPGYMIDVLTVDNAVKTTTASANETTYWFDNVSSNHKIDVTFKKVMVYFYATEKPWYCDSLQMFYGDNGGTGYWHKKVADTRNEIIYFQPDGKVITYWAGKLVGDFGWSINYSTSTPSLKWEGSDTFEEIDDYHMMTLNYSKTVRAFYSHH